MQLTTHPALCPLGRVNSVTRGGRPLEKSGLAVGAVIGIVLSAPLLPSWYFANNSPGAPDNVRPMDLDVKSDGSETTLTLPAHSFAALQYELQ